MFARLFKIYFFSILVFLVSSSETPAPPVTPTQNLTVQMIRSIRDNAIIYVQLPDGSQTYAGSYANFDDYAQGRLSTPESVALRTQAMGRLNSLFTGIEQDFVAGRLPSIQVDALYILANGDGINGSSVRYSDFVIDTHGSYTSPDAWNNRNHEHIIEFGHAPDPEIRTPRDILFHETGHARAWIRGTGGKYGGGNGGRYMEVYHEVNAELTAAGGNIDKALATVKKTYGPAAYAEYHSEGIMLDDIDAFTMMEKTFPDFKNWSPQQKWEAIMTLAETNADLENFPSDQVKSFSDRIKLEGQARGTQRIVDWANRTPTLVNPPAQGGCGTSAGCYKPRPIEDAVVFNGNTGLYEGPNIFPDRPLVNITIPPEDLLAFSRGEPFSGDVYVGDRASAGFQPRGGLTVQMEVPSTAVMPVPGSSTQVEVPVAAVKAGLNNGVTGVQFSYSATDPLGSLQGMGVAYDLYPPASGSADARINAGIKNPNNAAGGLRFANPLDQLSYDGAIAQRATATVAPDLAGRTVPSYGGAGAVSGSVVRPTSTGFEVVRVPYSTPAVMEAVAPSGSVIMIDAPSGSAANAGLRTAATELGIPSSANWSGANAAGGGAASFNYSEARLNEGLGAGLKSRWGIETFSGRTPTMGGQGVYVKMGNLQVVAAQVAPNGQGVLRGQVLFAVRTGDLSSSGKNAALAIDFARAAPAVKSAVAVGGTAAMIALPGIIGAGMHRITEGTWDGAGGAALDSQVAAMKDPVFGVTTGINATASLTATRTFQSLAAKHALVKAGGLLAVEAVPIVNVAAAVIAAPDIAGEYEKINIQYFGAPNPATATPRERLLSDTMLDRVISNPMIGGAGAMVYLKAGQAWNIYIREGDDFNVKTAYLQQLALTHTQPQDRFEALYFDKLGLGRRHAHVNRLGGDITTLYERNFNKPLDTQLKGSMPAGKTLSAMESTLRINAEKIKNEVRIRESFAAGRNFRDSAQWSSYSADAERAKGAVQDFRKKVDEAAKNNNYQIPEEDDAILEGARDRGSVMSGANSNIPKPTPDGKTLDGAAADYTANYDFVARGADIRPDPNYSFTNYMKALLGPDRVFYPNGFIRPNQRPSRAANSDWVGSYNDGADWAKYLDAASNRSTDMFGQYRDIMNGNNGVYDGKSGNINGGIPTLPSGDDNSWYGGDYNFYLPGYSGYP